MNPRKFLRTAGLAVLTAFFLALAPDAHAYGGQAKAQKAFDDAGAAEAKAKIQQGAAWAKFAKDHPGIAFKVGLKGGIENMSVDELLDLMKGKDARSALNDYDKNVKPAVDDAKAKNRTLEQAKKKLLKYTEPVKYKEIQAKKDKDKDQGPVVVKKTDEKPPETAKGKGSDADKKKWVDDYADWQKRRDQYQDDFNKNDAAKKKLQEAIKKFNANKDPAWRARNRGPLKAAIDKYKAEKERLKGVKPKLVAEKKVLIQRKGELGLTQNQGGLSTGGDAFSNKEPAQLAQLEGGDEYVWINTPSGYQLVKAKDVPAGAQAAPSPNIIIGGTKTATSKGTQSYAMKVEPDTTGKKKPATLAKAKTNNGGNESAAMRIMPMTPGSGDHGATAKTRTLMASETHKTPEVKKAKTTTKSKHTNTATTNAVHEAVTSAAHTAAITATRSATQAAAAAAAKAAAAAAAKEASKKAAKSSSQAAAKPAAPSYHPSGMCFVAGTLVQTPSGVRKIEELNVDDKVLSYDERTGKIEPAAVLRTWKSQRADLIKLETPEGSVTCSQNHRFYTVDQGWLAANQLKPGGKIMEHDPAHPRRLLAVAACSVTAMNLKSPVNVYNLTVAKNLDYFVGPDAVLCHNTK